MPTFNMSESLFFGSMLAIFTIFFALALNLIRSRFSPQAELQANCLLTRYPLVFITGRRSLFYFLKFWNWIPQILAEHGYETFVLNLPWRKPALRRQALKKFLSNCEKNNKKVHLIAEESAEKDLTWLSQLPDESIKSCWIIRSKRHQVSRLNPQDLRPQSEKWREFELSQTIPKTSFLLKLPLWLHNLIHFPEKPLDPLTLGLTNPKHVDQIRTQYLKLAILLAESDIR